MWIWTLRRAAFSAVVVSLATIAPAAAANLTVGFADSAWTGKAIPKNQHCTKFGGKGATPPLNVSGLPPGTAMIVVEFNDRDFSPLSRDGGHGIIGFKHSGGDSATLPAVPGETATMPEGVVLVKKNQASGSFYRPGYLPPCSGGRNHKYFAVVKARDAAGKDLAEAKITIGRY